MPMVGSSAKRRFAGLGMEFYPQYSPPYQAWILQRNAVSRAWASSSLLMESGYARLGMELGPWSWIQHFISTTTSEMENSYAVLGMKF